MEIYLDSGMHSLRVHEMILHRILWDLLGPAEDSLAEDKLAVPSPQGGGVGGTVGDGGVLGHGHGAALVSLPLRQDVGDVLVTFDKVLKFWIHLNSKENQFIGGAFRTATDHIRTATYQY